MILLLVRHATAQNRDISVDDDKRTLTVKGIKEFKKAARGIRCILSDVNDAMILSSPLPRALQTAQILAEAFGAKEVRTFTSISEGDLGAFVKESSEMPKKGYVFVVGHEPSLGNWSEALCGVRLPFKKGACAAIEYSPNKPYDSSLLWFAQPGMLRSLKVK
jgi:phosphohistidine phosphatase